MKFEVQTLSADHLLGRELVDARDEAEARALVRARGLTVAKVRPAGALGGLTALPGSGGRFSVVLFSQELLALLRAGLALVEALEALSEKEPQALTRRVLERILGGLREGKRFSATLGEQPEHFSALYVGLVRTAEGTSDLPRALERFIEYQERVSRVRGKIVSAAIYPAILMAVGLLVSGFLLGYVVPRFATVYEGTGRPLPWLSELMLRWGRFAGDHAFLVTLVLLAVLLGGALALQRLWRSGELAALAARLPGVAERVRMYQLSRLYLALGLLMEGGIALVPAMRSVEGLVPPRLRAALDHSRVRVESGYALSQAFEEAELTTPISLRLLRVGERTGQLGALLQQSAAFYDEEIARWIDRFTRSFEPLLMAIIGLVVGVIVLTLYMPIFDLAGSL
ncbi:MAG: type II secretion system F family protein [Paucibacter sp.]|nr:type II secretion system F family protein [Roseateles sp.]